MAGRDFAFNHIWGAIGSGIGSYGVWYAMGMPPLSLAVFAAIAGAAIVGSLALGYLAPKIV
jgi:hypothetical protein